ncbi:MAG: SMI1/KNR4 family protein [Clostridia bacterium]|nr:SMI1/KNR4 family protein [Clostridia bacterium]
MSIIGRSTLKDTTGASKESIVSAEEKLGVKFSDEYKALISNMGACIYKGHEIVGICKYPYLNVVDVTLEAREFNPIVPKNLYVVENTHFDSIYIWQDESGTVYQTYPNCKPKRIADSLSEYLEL